MRRYKRDVQEQISGSFLERQVSKHPVPASPKEEEVYDRLAEAKFLSFDGTRRTGQLLFKTVLEKALFSSPASCLATVRQRLRRIEKEISSEAEKDRVTLRGIAESLERVGAGDFAKYQRLVEMLKPGGYLNWRPTDLSDRIVLFTERIETLHFLEETLADAAKSLVCDSRTVPGLVRLALLQGTATPGGLRVTAESVETFKEKYVSLARIAKEEGTSSRALMQQCHDKGIRLLFVPTTRRGGPQPFISVADRDGLGLGSVEGDRARLAAPSTKHATLNCARNCRSFLKTRLR